MIRLYRSFIFIVISLTVLSGYSCGPAGSEGEKPATELEGLWAAHRDYGPEVRGTLDLFDRGDGWSARIAGFTTPVRVDGDSVTFEIEGDRGAFRGRFDSKEGSVAGHWIQPPTAANGVRFASPVDLNRQEQGHWRGEVTPLDDTMTFFLSLTRNEDDSIGGFLRNPEANFGRHFDIRQVVRDGNRLRFIEPDHPQPRLQGSYYPDYEAFSIFIPDAGGTFDFTRVDDDSSSAFYPRPASAGRYVYRPPSREDDGWETGSLDQVGMAVEPIEEMIQMIIDTPMDSVSAPYIHAVLIARHGKLVLEEYFHGYSAGLPHETRSASKTVTSTLIGLAIHERAPLSVDSKIYSVMYGGDLPENLDPRRERMTLKHLLTMTPGLACDDNDSESPGNETTMQIQTDEPDWLRYTLELPMVHEPGKVAAYCSASTNLAGGLLSTATGSWRPDLYREYFARPMQMGLYHMNLMPTGDGYGGGGLYIRGRDFLKMGQIFLDGGKWKSRKLLGDDWIRDAVAPLEHMFDQGYGYAWWVMPFPYANRTVQAFYAGGNGGQYVIGVPELDLAIVFFAGNYGQRVTHLVKTEHVPKYIIRAVESGER